MPNDQEEEERLEAPPQGPFVQAALFAEIILEDKTGTMSIIRMIDRVTHTVAGADPPEDMPPFTRKLQTVVSLKAGKARGRQNFTMTMEMPDGKRKEVAQGTFHFEGGPGQGVNLLFNLNVTFGLEGLYWFDFALAGQLLTRMPFEVRYNRLTSAGAPPPG